MIDAPSPNSPSILGYLILLRLIAKDKAPAAPSAICKSLGGYFIARLALSSDAWKKLVADTIDELINAGFILKDRHVTEVGLAKLNAFLGFGSLPQNCTFKAIASRHLIAKALNILPQSNAKWDALADAKGLGAAIVARSSGLPFKGVPTPTEALDLLAWSRAKSHALELIPAAAFSSKEFLRASMLDGRKGDVEKILPALLTNAPNGKADQLRSTVISNWLKSLDDSEASQVPHESSKLANFAKRVRELASSSADGRFGDSKVFISHVWRHFKASREGADVSREEFDQRLIESNQQGLLKLSRADLVNAMDPQDVSTSEIQYANTAFHLIRLDH